MINIINAYNEGLIDRHSLYPRVYVTEQYFDSELNAYPFERYIVEGIPFFRPNLRELPLGLAEVLKTSGGVQSLKDVEQHIVQMIDTLGIESSFLYFAAGGFRPEDIPNAIRKNKDYRYRRSWTEEGDGILGSELFNLSLIDQIGAIVNSLSQIVIERDSYSKNRWITRNRETFELALRTVKSNILNFSGNNGIRDIELISSTSDELRRYPFGVVKITPKVVFPSKTETLMLLANSDEHRHKIYVVGKTKHASMVNLTPLSIHPNAEPLVWLDLLDEVYANEISAQIRALGFDTDQLVTLRDLSGDSITDFIDKVRNIQHEKARERDRIRTQREFLEQDRRK